MVTNVGKEGRVDKGVRNASDKPCPQEAGLKHAPILGSTLLIMSTAFNVERPNSE